MKRRVLGVPAWGNLARWLRICVVGAGGFAHIVAAQISSDSEEQRRRVQRETEERLRGREAPRVALPAPDLPADPRSLALPEETPCFPIARLALQGRRVGEFPWLQEHLDRYRGRYIGREGLNLMVKRLTALLIERGFVTTRVGIPEQDLSSGTLTLVLIPGIIRDIRFASDAQGSWRAAFPARPGDLLNLRDLEQGLEQLKRVPSQDAELQIVPGEQPGESDVVVTLMHAKAWRIGLTMDDSGVKATGRMQASLIAFLDNPLGLNDLLSLSVNSDAQNDNGRRGTRGDSLSYSVPWGYWTFTLATSRYDYHQTIKGINQIFTSSGESQSSELKIHRIVHRDQSTKTALQLRMLNRRSRSSIEDVEIAVQRRETTAAELGLIHRRYLGTAQLDLTAAHREGVPWLGGQQDASGRPPQAPTFRYALQTLDVAASVPFTLGGERLRWLSAWRGQTTGTPLYATEFFTIGGRYTVRGFDGEQMLAAERGWYWRNELEWTPGSPGPAAYFALDQGRVGGPSAAVLAGRRLVGGALGLRGAVGAFTFDVFAGRALSKPTGFTTARPALGFQLSYQY